VPVTFFFRRQRRLFCYIGTDPNGPTPEFRQKLQSRGIEACMSRKGRCYDNAAMKSFWSSLKNERVHRCAYQTRAEARQSIFEWIELYYNRVRLHSSLGYKSPVDFENQLN
jgi:putative transposase